MLVNIGPGETPKYRLLAKNTRKVPEGDVLQRLVTKSGMGISQCRYMLDNLGEVIFEGLAANETLDSGFFFAKLYPTGTIPSLTAQPTKEANPVKGRIFFKGAIAEKLAALELVNETKTVDPLIYEIQQDDVEGLNRIESATARVVMNVNRGKIDPEQEDNGVWLEDLKTGVKVADGDVSYSDSATCHVTFPTLPPTGKYRLVLATRDGEDPAEYVLARATRNVTVVNGEVSHG